MIVRTLAVLSLFAGAAMAQTPAQPGPQELRAGDRVLLRVEGEKELSDTFTVIPGPTLDLPGIGEVPLTGVARNDLERYLAERIGRYLKRAEVRAWALVRLSIVGEVEKPGFYAVPTDLVLTDALMVTGGPTRDARIKAVRIEREGAPLWGGEPLQRGLSAGYTIDQFGLRDGDRIVFPRVSRGWVLPVISVAVPAALLAITQLIR